MEQFPFAVDNSDSPIVAAAAGGDDSSSLVTASSQGSFLPTSEDDNGVGMMHSSMQQHTDDENDHLHHDAVFANPTHQHALTAETPVSVQQPHLLPEDPIHFGATIVDLPPLSSHILPVSHRALPMTTTQSTRPSPVVNTSTATTPSSLLSGVDVLKSAGSRVTSVLSTLGYNLGMNSNTSAYVTTATAPTIRTSNTTQNPVSPISQQYYEPQPESISPNKVTLDEGANEFAYINVTDEDEVDVWLDENHASTCRSDSTFHVNNDYSFAGRRGNILAILLANDVSPPISSANDTDTDLATTPVMTTSTNGDPLVHFTEQANTMRLQAVEARKDGNLQTALDRHSDAAKLYHKAALQIRNADGT
jgi:hypothetical protein